MIEVRLLDKTLEVDYRRFVDEARTGLIYYTLEYQDFLLDILNGASAHYFVGLEDGQVACVLPCFVTEAEAGRVINSLPFYGSHGGLLGPDASDAAKRAVINAYTDFVSSGSTLSATLVEPLLGESDERGVDLYSHDMLDGRTGQVSTLPDASADDIGAAVMANMHQKSRNSLRKGLKAEFSVTHTGTDAARATLFELHRANMQAIGGTHKSTAVFDSLAKHLTYDRQYRIYEATAPNGDLAASMMVLYHRDTVEYFIPASDQAYRSQQPLSVLIYHAMIDAVQERASRFWNWGGTWSSQAGVYRFKSRWGAQDRPYRYHISLPGGLDPLRELGPQGLLSAFPYFFTCPFDRL